MYENRTLRVEPDRARLKIPLTRVLLLLVEHDGPNNLLTIRCCGIRYGC